MASLITVNGFSAQDVAPRVRENFTHAVHVSECRSPVGWLWVLAAGDHHHVVSVKGARARACVRACVRAYVRA